MRMRMPLMCACVALFSASSANLFAENEKEPDEALYLLNRLDALLIRDLSWNDQPKLQIELIELRKELAVLEAHIESQHLPNDLLSAYKEVDGIFDDLVTMLAALGSVDETFAGKGWNDALQSLGNGVKDGIKAAQTQEMLGQLGADPDTAKIGGLVVLAGTVLSDIENSLNQSSKREASKSDARERAILRYQENFATHMSRISQFSETLSRTRGWQDGESTFTDENTQKAVSQAWAKEDWPLLKRLFTDLAHNEPRNPFRQMRFCFVTLMDQSTESREEAFKHIDYAIRQVPDGSIYDQDRLLLFAIGVLTVPPSHPERVEQYADRALKIDSVDKEGLFRKAKYQSMWGQGRWRETTPILGQLFKELPHDASVRYDSACWWSLSGNADNAIKGLKDAYYYGYNNIKHVRKDSDFDFLRTNRPDEFQTLTTVKTTATINWGIFNDDIILTNQSPFTITNVTVNATFTVAGEPVQTEVHADSVPGGGTYKFTNAISISKSRFEKWSSFTLKCDQKE